jgi:DNA repair exonuclease SbcCD nuclease subunit
VHQCVEGATVGPADFTFSTAPDVIRAADLPTGFAAVLSGHIHRHQVLTMDLRGRPLTAPVLYPGSIERTSSAEIGEEKGYMTVAFRGSEAKALRWQFHRLPARPMLQHSLTALRWSTARLDAAVRARVAAAPVDAVLLLRIEGDVSGADLRVLSAGHLRSYAPATQNVEVRLPGELRSGQARTPRSRREQRTDANLELEL